ncbi:MAG: hypothetical protein FJX71_01150 [Alphaproteobacteria bacterium]|nr:hypothetical protein [Alphaproteobacteria bacterium]
MKKISFITLALSIGLTSIVFSAERQQGEVAVPTSLKELMALPDTTTVLNLSELNVVNDEVAPYNVEDISITRLIEQAKLMNESDRRRITTLTIESSLLGNSGFKKLAEGFIPLFPSLRVLKLSCDGIEEGDAPTLYRLLATQPSISFANILENRLVQRVRYDVSNGLNIEDKARVTEKVIAFHKSEIEEIASPQFPAKWKEVHERFYKLQEAH